MSKCSDLHTRFILFLMNELPGAPKGSPCLGLTPELKEYMEQLNVRQIQRIAEKASQFLIVKIETNELKNAIQCALRRDEEESIIDDFIDHDASYKMMKALFGMSTVEFSERREKLKKKGQDQHRPKDPTEIEERYIWEAWQAKSDLPDIERYLQVSYYTGLPLKLIWKHIESVS